MKGESTRTFGTATVSRASPRKTDTSLAGSTLPASFHAMSKFDREAVLNGIAYDAQHDRLFVTGKQWPSIFEIKLIPKK